ncbi:hypothetical protein [Priestia megaterium]|uniref:hypothetical protein n=1 Tax=Priestia megaterium TaxID=1404 RepID=UPI003008E9FE
MFQLKEVSIDNFIKDNAIQLHRYQRKQRWNNSKNFELTISIFKEFPIGIVVINKEDQGGKVKKWLLDDRQRRSALVKVKNPEYIYI